ALATASGVRSRAGRTDPTAAARGACRIDAWHCGHAHRRGAERGSARTTGMVATRMERYRCDAAARSDGGPAGLSRPEQPADRNGAGQVRGSRLLGYRAIDATRRRGTGGRRDAHWPEL